MKRSLKKPDKIQIRVVHSTSMRLDQWRRSPELVETAQKIFNTPAFQTIMAVLRNETTANYGLSGGTHDDHIAHAYKAEGYQMALNNLEAFALPMPSERSIEATFEPEGKTQIVK